MQNTKKFSITIRNSGYGFYFKDLNECLRAWRKLKIKSNYKMNYCNLEINLTN